VIKQLDLKPESLSELTTPQDGSSEEERKRRRSTSRSISPGRKKTRNEIDSAHIQIQNEKQTLNRPGLQYENQSTQESIARSKSSMSTTPRKKSLSPSRSRTEVTSPPRTKRTDFESPLLSSSSLKPEKKKIVFNSPHLTVNNGIKFSASDWVDLGRKFKHKAEEMGRTTKAGAVYYAACTLCYFTKQSMVTSDYMNWYESTRDIKEFCRGILQQQKLNELLSILYYCEAFFTIKACNEHQSASKQLIHKAKGVTKVLKEVSQDEKVKLDDLAKDLEEKLAKVSQKMEDYQRRFEKASFLLKEAYKYCPTIRIQY
jgi:hypothetical protein